MDTLIIIGIAIAAVVLFVFPYYRKHKRLEGEALKAEKTALKYGLHEPASLHPVVDPAACIGTGNCIDVCPEKNVLGLVAGQARPISPARCIGHGLCERSCPVEAIQLVFGTEKRGVHIPRIQENFETNVPGMFVIGELGGMGLIRNAFEQGRQCVEGIVAEEKSSVDGVLDVLIIGCGPSGLSAALNCSHHGLRFEVLEKDDVGGAVRTYPRKKLVMTSPLNVPGYGKLSFREIVKEDLVQLWDEMISKADLKVRTFEGVDRVGRRSDGIFEVHTPKNTYLTQRVILAIGKRGVPRKLGVPGEEGANVSYSLREPEVFEGDRVTVVGGGDSAVEAALSLSDQPGTRVVLSYRKDRLSRVKEGNLKRIEASIEAGQVDVRWSTTLTEIGADRILLRHESGEETEVGNDYVLIFAGGELPTGFLKACGIEIDTKFGEPVR